MINGIPTLADLQGWLQEARIARHNLYVNRGVRVFVDQNGERVEYSFASLARLDAYIASLEAQIAAFGLATQPTRGPIGFWF